MRILVVDDEELLGRSIARTLDASGHEAVVEHDPDIALERVRTDWFDLILCDRRMPTMYGDDFLAEVRARLWPDSPVLVLMASEGDISDGAGAADTVVAKPLHPIQLRTLVGMTLDVKALRTHAMTQRLTRLALIAS